MSNSEPYRYFDMNVEFSGCDHMMIEPTTTKRIKHSESERKLNLSDLPTCVILHILSFLSAKDAIRTCILSSTWKNLWKKIPSLILHSSHFPMFRKFNTFVARVLFLRDSSIALHTLDFDLYGCINPNLLKTMLNYAISHNVHRLGLSLQCEIEHIPHSIFSSQTLTYLKLSLYPIDIRKKTLLPTSLNLPALTFLHIENFIFCAGGDNDDYVEPFFALKRLNTLVLDNCIVKDAKLLRVSSATLVNLTMYNHSEKFYRIKLCTPSLCTFAFIGTPIQCFTIGSLSSVRHVDIDMDSCFSKADPRLHLLSWLQLLSNIKSLTVSAATLQVFSMYPDLVMVKHNYLGNLKSLKVKIKPLKYELLSSILAAKLKAARLKKVMSTKKALKFIKAFKERFKSGSLIPDGIMGYLIQNSPLAKVEIIDCCQKRSQTS